MTDDSRKTDSVSLGISPFFSLFLFCPLSYHSLRRITRKNQLQFTAEICTIIYYPREKLNLIKKDHVISADRYRLIINRMIEIAALLSSKYTRSKVRKAMPEDYAYIIENQRVASQRKKPLDSLPIILYFCIPK